MHGLLKKRWSMMSMNISERESNDCRLIYREQKTAAMFLVFRFSRIFSGLCDFDFIIW